MLVEVIAQLEALSQAEIQARADAKALAEALSQAETQANTDAKALAEAQAKVDAYAHANANFLAEQQAKSDALALAEELARADAKFEAVTEVERHTHRSGNSVTTTNSKDSQVFRPSQVPSQADLLKRVLSNIFPKGTVYWNKSLMDQIFLAQVEDVLICLHDRENPCNLKKFNKDGWKVLVCSTEDLIFPRRLERGIRQIQRSGKMSETV